LHDVIAGMRRDRGTRPDQKRALSTGELRSMVTAIYERLRALGFDNVYEVNFGLTRHPRPRQGQHAGLHVGPDERIGC
jgi:hypothetical protein